jgi:hypothetical protein
MLGVRPETNCGKLDTSCGKLSARLVPSAVWYRGDGSQYPTIDVSKGRYTSVLW